MSHSKSNLILSLTLIITNISAIAGAKTDCVNCGFDGKEVNDIRTIDFKLAQEDYYTSSISGGRVIDFESFADYQNINGFNLGGVTLTCPASGIVQIFDNRCGTAYQSPTKVIGTNECSCMDINVNPLVGAFDYPATYIALWAGDGGVDTDSWELEAFDAPVEGNSLGIVSSGDWNGYPYSKLEISAPNIWRFEARWTGANCGIAYDDLEFFIPVLSLEKVDDVNDGDCVLPGREIIYTINYSPDVPEDNNMRIIDYLPVEVDYNSSSPEGDYNETTRTLTWIIGSIPTGNRGLIIINTKVNNLAEPCSVFVNNCELRGDLIYNVAEVNTPVCAWCPEIIYVDDSATSGKNNGMRWEDAYLDLQDALDRAAIGFGSQIWVAAGTYNPSVKLINGVPVYGHFAGNESSLSQRDLNDPNYETILTGTVTASGLSQNNILDGFTRTGSASIGVVIENAYLEVSNCLISGRNCGVYGINSSFIVTDCIIQNNMYQGIYANSAAFTSANCTIQNNGYGIQAINSGFTVADCTIQNNNVLGIQADFQDNNTLPETRISNSIIRHNGNYGIYFYRPSASYSPVVTGCKIFAHTSHGIYLYYSNASIQDNWIYHNVYGVYFSYANSITIRNNTIVSNSRGIFSPYGGMAPVITSSIIWGNSSSDLYNCSGSYLWLTANGDPCFVNADANDFHLKPDSNCIDAGDPNFRDFNDKDIDGECRIMFGKLAIRVDIGADELYRPRADFNHDDIVNFIDFAMLANSWATTVGEPDYNDLYDLEDDNVIDIHDLAQFCNDWLWIAPWSTQYQSLGIGGMDMVIEGTGESLALAEETCALAVSEPVLSATEEVELTTAVVEQLMSNEQIQALIDWTQQLWQSDPNIRAMVGQAAYDRILDSLKEQLAE
jgi:parallel beta-helix repeat protein